VQRGAAEQGPYVTIAEDLAPAPTMSYADRGVPTGSAWYRLVVVAGDGSHEVTRAIRIDAAVERTLAPELLSTYDPGPGRAILLQYRVGAAGPARLELFDVAGRSIRRFDETSPGPGIYTREWDRRDAGGVAVSRGLYFVRLQVESRTSMQKLLLLHD
jgi:hypothetical protein